MQLVLIGLALLAASVAGQYHDPVYLMGGYGSTSTSAWNGVWLADAGNRTVKHLTPNHAIYYAYTIKMDADNRRVILSVGGTTSTSTVYQKMIQSGIYRLDPATYQITTLLAHTAQYYYPRRVLVNQDADYVFINQERRLVGTSWQTHYQVLKVTPTGAVSTILTTQQAFGASGNFYGMSTNIETGNYLLNVYYSSTLYYGVLDLADDGSFTTFAGGPSPNYGWYGYYDNMYQNFDTAAIEGQYNGLLYQLKKGALRRTTLWNLGYPGSFYPRYCSKFDLQSAPRKRVVADGYDYQWRNNAYYYAPSVFQVDVTPPYNVTAINCDPNMSLPSQSNYPYAFDFYRGRHVQSASAGYRKWQLRISCPNHPGKAYAIALSARGYRPPIPLPDGRKIYLVPDHLTPLSISNRLMPFFNPGPGVLDGQGTALATIDTSLLGKLNTPLWIAVAILDPAAPFGLAYLPDTYVLRL